MKKYGVLLAVLLVALLSFKGIYGFLQLTIHVDDVVEVAGLMNIGACYAVGLLSLYSISGWLAIHCNIPSPIMRDKQIIIICLVVTPTLTYFTNNEIQKNIQGYVECKDLKQTGTRYSIKTYAISPELCEQQ
ncbi:hypothetical protein [Vibrio owensii]|uniref:hypothetical protein n=1 Tax=Vibrio owensii TaxID=696485 RepID=UPI0038CE99BA